MAQESLAEFELLVMLAVLGVFLLWVAVLATMLLRNAPARETHHVPPISVYHAGG